MYLSHWQLERRPFENISDGRSYYPAESQQGAMLKLRYAVENRRGAALLCGPSGSGKSLLAQQLRKHLSKPYRPLVHLVFPQLLPEELLSYLAEELGAPGIGPLSTVDQTVRRLQQFLTQNAVADQHAVVLIDEAHLIDDTRSFEALRLLLNFEYQAQPAMTLIFVGGPALLPQIERMPALEERLGVKCLLRPLSADETAAYVEFRLQAAGAKRTIFEADALQALHELARGLPRQINRLGDLALLVGFAEERTTITAEQIEAVAEELVAVTPD